LMTLKYSKRLILLWSLIFVVRFSSRSRSIFVLKREITHLCIAFTDYLIFPMAGNSKNQWLFPLWHCVRSVNKCSSVEFHSMGLILLLLAIQKRRLVSSC
jgi:hypothetical protein